MQSWTSWTPLNSGSLRRAIGRDSRQVLLEVHVASGHVQPPHGLIRENLVPHLAVVEVSAAVANEHDVSAGVEIALEPPTLSLPASSPVPLMARGNNRSALCHVTRQYAGSVLLTNVSDTGGAGRARGCLRWEFRAHARAALGVGLYGCAADVVVCTTLYRIFRHNHWL
jgi:hypothetical protein